MEKCKHLPGPLLWKTELIRSTRCSSRRFYRLRSTMVWRTVSAVEYCDIFISRRSNVKSIQLFDVNPYSPHFKVPHLLQCYRVGNIEQLTNIILSFFLLLFAAQFLTLFDADEITFILQKEHFDSIV